ncbi:Phage holin, partial [Dysosmobacter welbionis]
GKQPHQKSGQANAGTELPLAKHQPVYAGDLVNSHRADSHAEKQSDSAFGSARTDHGEHYADTEKNQCKILPMP